MIFVWRRGGADTSGQERVSVILVVETDVHARLRQELFSPVYGASRAAVSGPPLTTGWKCAAQTRAPWYGGLLIQISSAHTVYRFFILRRQCMPLPSRKSVRKRPGRWSTKWPPGEPSSARASNASRRPAGPRGDAGGALRHACAVVQTDPWFGGRT